MKLRMGFVSNSSSSSFLIYGFCINKEEIREDLKNGKLPELEEGLRKAWDEEKAKTWCSLDSYEDYISSEYFSEALEAVAGVPYSAHYPYDEVFFGRSWDSVGDNETGKQFKDSVAKELKALFGKQIKVETHEAAWSDG